MKKKVLFFIESLGCGGAEKSIVSLLQLLDYTRLDVDLLLYDDCGVFKKLLPKEVNIIKFPLPKGLFKLLNRLSLYVFSVRLHLTNKQNYHSSEIRWMYESYTLPKMKKKYDIAIAYQQGFPTYYIAEKVKANIKLAWVNIDLKSSKYREEFNRPIYDNYQNIIAVSDVLYQTLISQNYMSRHKLVTLYDILNVNIIRQMAKESIDGKWNYGDVTKIVTVGRIEKQKNYPLAVKTAKLLKAHGINFHWYFVGGGTESAYIKSLISQYGLGDCVFQIGEQPNPYTYISNADIYVHTASFEGYGLTIAEAKILGKPVVSTNFTVVYDQISDGVNGLIAEMNPQCLADKIEMLINNKDLRQKIEANVALENNRTAETEVCKFYKLIGL